MLNKRSIIVFLIFMVVGLNIVLMVLWKEGKKVIIDIDGFEVEYSLNNKIVTIDIFDTIKLGSSISEISSKLGEPNTWIGSGILQPVYFVENNSAIVLYFEYPDVCKDLEQIILYKENGEIEVIKEK